MKYICIYHANCLDGFGAAYAMWSKLRDDCEYIAASYQEEPPDVTGANVFIVDFSYKRNVLIEMAGKARHILVIDHHKTAQADLVDLPENVTTIFNMGKSGAVLTWEYCWYLDTPKLLLHIQDRDLWNFELEGTNEICAALQIKPRDFKTWHDLATLSSNLHVLREKGATILEYRDHVIQQAINNGRHMLEIQGYKVPAINLSPEFASEAGNILAQGYPFAAVYSQNGSKRIFSLRSTKEGIDVSAVAAKYGGGGHKHAAGFSIGHHPAPI